jgi:hypothetical protein
VQRVGYSNGASAKVHNPPSRPGQGQQFNIKFMDIF